MRSARTDKGVSAVGQVVSLKMLVGDQHLVQKINQELPAEIRVFGFTQVTGSFDARLLCDRRRSAGPLGTASPRITLSNRLAFL